MVCSRQFWRDAELKLSGTLAFGRLFFPSRPAAITWLVIAGTIREAIQSFVRRPFAHVGEEISEIAPALANANSSTAVSVIGYMISIRTALNHCRPRFVSVAFGFRFPCCMTMFLQDVFVAKLEDFRDKATTAFSGFLCELIAKYDCFFSAIAAANPSRATSLIARGFCQNHKLPESLTDQLKGRTHWRII